MTAVLAWYVFSLVSFCCFIFCFNNSSSISLESVSSMMIVLSSVHVHIRMLFLYDHVLLVLSMKYCLFENKHVIKCN